MKSKKSLRMKRQTRHIKRRINRRKTKKGGQIKAPIAPILPIPLRGNTPISPSATSSSSQVIPISYKNPVQEYGSSLSSGGVYQLAPTQYQVTSSDGSTNLLVTGIDNKYNVFIPTNQQNIQNAQNIVGAKYILDTDVNTMYQEPTGGGILLTNPIYNQ